MVDNEAVKAFQKIQNQREQYAQTESAKALSWPSDEAKTIAVEYSQQYLRGIVKSGEIIFISIAQIGHMSLYVYFRSSCLIFGLSETVSFLNHDFARIDYSDPKCLDFNHINQLILDFYSWYIQWHSTFEKFKVFEQSFKALIEKDEPQV